MTPAISIIIPCYNMGQYLEEAVSSVLLHPDKEDYEIIVVDDGSDDLVSIEIFEKLKQKGIQIYHQQNKGLSSARNTGIKVAKGSYIIPLDADNKIRPAFIEASISIFTNKPEIDIIYSDAELFGRDSGRWQMGEFDFPRLLVSNYIDACACFRKKVWESLGGYDENMFLGCEDWDFWLRAYLNNFKFEYVKEVFFDYRVRDNSMVTVTKKNSQKINEYIFSKPELKIFTDIRRRLEQMQFQLNYSSPEPSFTGLFKTFAKKIKGKIQDWI